MKKYLLMPLAVICLLTFSCKKDTNNNNSTGEVIIQADGLMYDYEVIEMLNDGSNKTGRVFTKKKHIGKFKETFTVKDNTILKLSFEDQAENIAAPIRVQIDYKGKHIYDKNLLQINEEVVLKLK